MEQYGNYLGILKWSLAQNDGTKPSEVKPLSEEDREFFEKAVEAACESDASKMKKLLDEMKVDTIDDEKRISLLELLEEFLENIDNARDFQNLGGYQFVVDLMNSTTNELVVQQCLSLLGTSSQNQPKVQQILLDCNIIPQIMDFVEKSSNLRLKTKGIRCLTCLISNFEPSCKVFLFHNGLSMLKSILFDDSITDISLLQKSLILLKDLSYQEIMFMRKFLSKELVNRLADHFLCHEDIDIKETTLYLLQYILNLDRKEFSKDDVIESLKKALPSIQAYCQLDDTPSEIKDAEKAIEKYILDL